jgi:thiamine-phosphate pyrophosphorylase
VLAGRRLYLCTPDRPDLTDFISACIEGGVDIVQLREKHLEARQLLARAEVAMEACRAHGVPFVVNDRPDLALAVGAQGCHVGQDDTPARIARKILDLSTEPIFLGLSTHAPEELQAALLEPVDYLSAGPVVPTPTKLGRPGTGLGYLSLAASRTDKPLFVTGGVTPETVPALVEAGARGFVVVRWLTESSEPFEAARALRQAIDAALDARGGPSQAQTGSS